MPKKILMYFIISAFLLVLTVAPILADDLSDSLLAASLQGDLEKVQSLISQGANVNITDKDGRTPMINAAEKGQTDIVKLLLEKKVLLNVKTKTGESPLILAAQNGNTEIVKLILDKSVDAKDYFPALAAAAKNGRLDVVTVFSEKVDFKFACIDILCLAAKYGKTDIVKLFIDKEARFNEKAYDSESTEKPAPKWSPLMFAVANGQTETVKLLVAQKGLDPDSYDETGKNCLMLACEKGLVDITAALLQTDTYPRRQDKSGWTPLMYAVKSGNIEVVKLIAARLDKGTIAEKNNKGETALDLAVAGNQTAIATFLKTVWPKS